MQYIGLQTLKQGKLNFYLAIERHAASHINEREYFFMRQIDSTPSLYETKTYCIENRLLKN